MQQLLSFSKPFGMPQPPSLVKILIIIIIIMQEHVKDHLVQPPVSHSGQLDVLEGLRAGYEL